MAACVDVWHTVDRKARAVRVIVRLESIGRSMLFASSRDAPRAFVLLTYMLEGTLLGG